MAKRFESAYEARCDCGSSLDWEWDPEVVIFVATCDDCMKGWRLTPLTAQLERDDEDAVDDEIIDGIDIDD